MTRPYMLKYQTKKAFEQHKYCIKYSKVVDCQQLLLIGRFAQVAARFDRFRLSRRGHAVYRPVVSHYFDSMGTGDGIKQQRSLASNAFAGAAAAGD